MGKANITNWISGRINEPGRVILGGIVVGLIAGSATAGMKRLISLVGEGVTAHMDPQHGNITLAILPLVGILLATLWQVCIGKKLAHPTEQLRNQANAKKSTLGLADIFTPIVGCVMTIGFGGSAGAEGPSAYSGSAAGNWLARILNVSSQGAIILFGAGAAAGIAGIFKSPVGGILFTFEILGMGFTPLGFAVIVTAALISFSTAYALSGFTWDLHLIQTQTFSPSDLGWFAALGICCGLYSLYYRYTNRLGRRFFDRIRNRWFAAIVSGSLLGLGIYFFPILYGEGYTVVDKLVNGSDAPMFEYSIIDRLETLDYSQLILLLGLGIALLLKGFAVAATNSGGGVAGEFAPTIFAGAIAGFLFATLSNMLLGSALPVDTCALIGGAAVMSGALRAPLMAMFIGTEISDRYNLMLPFIVVCALSWLVVYLCTPTITTSTSANKNGEG